MSLKITLSTHQNYWRKWDFFFLHSIILINGLRRVLSLMIDLAEVLMTALCFVFLCRCQRVHFQFQSVMMVILVIAFSPFVSLFPTYWSLFKDFVERMDRYQPKNQYEWLALLRVVGKIWQLWMILETNHELGIISN